MADLTPAREATAELGAMFRVIRGVRTVFFLMFLAWSGLSLAAAESPLFSAAREHNTTYERLRLELDLAQLRAERLEIQARDRVGELQAAEALLTARITHRKGLEEFYHGAIRAAYGVETALVEERMAEIRLATAEDRREQAELRYRRGLIPEAEVVEARLDARSARLDRDTALWSRQDAEIAFDERVGVRWSPALLPPVPSAPPEDPQRWISNDPQLSRAEIVLELAQFRRDRLPGNASAFDRRIAEAEVRRADFELQQAVAATDQRYEQLRRRMVMERETIHIRNEQLTLRDGLARESRTAFERGMVTTEERDQAILRQLQARLQLLAAERDYHLTVVSRRLGYGLSSGEEP